MEKEEMEQMMVNNYFKARIEILCHFSGINQNTEVNLSEESAQNYPELFRNIQS